MTVLVTGASGCIGRAVISALREAGHTPVSAGTSAPLDDSVEHVEWDIRAPADNRFAGYDITAVIHAAGVSGAHLSRDDAHGANVTGPRNVLDAFPKARFIYLSCADVYDPRRGYKDLYEERGPAELDCFTTEYERSKVEAENVVTRLRPDALILRPAPSTDPATGAISPSFSRLPARRDSSNFREAAARKQRWPVQTMWPPPCSQVSSTPRPTARSMWPTPNPMFCVTPSTRSWHARGSCRSALTSAPPTSP